MGMTADDRGNVYVFNWLSHSYIRLFPDGRGSAMKEYNTGRVDYNPRTGDYCQCTSKETRHFFRDGRTPVSLGGESAPHLAVMPAIPLDDGKSAIVENSQAKLYSKVNFYSETGSPESSIKIPNDDFYGGASAGKRWLVVSGWTHRCCLIDLADRRVREAELQPAPLPGRKYGYLIRVEPDGSETLLQIGLESRVVRAFPLPAK
jgi:hypothetical protein